ncbi:ABC transporter ATP-binding protein [Bradyrhizobium sp. CB3481]|uniref:ABC transporter ATP-binding protein n=1 Tax=Bradyrhizobium sp. CB3481 TaxID=3039158 RepID=UPI0024B05B85|nr:ABC transporter ATP-binding protein [Bradyrhizobium sp. CB3481]WFU18957.1 ABC transporter ATP-binding protein [Bradyrhizobium sp. CB3481]
MSASVNVEHVSKSFVLAQHGGYTGLFEALRAGKPSVTQREIHALQNISFSIGPGERVGIIGRNGAGKTTLLSLLAGITQPTTGKIGVVGHVHAMLTIGMVLREEATGRENILLDGAVHGHSRDFIEELAPKIVEFAELGDFIDRPVRTYSSGMKARLAFAMGAFTKSDILIIDETLSVGDAAFSRKATRRMKQLAGEGQIVIAVSHSMGAIADICDRCLWLDNGRLIMDGPADEVTKAYVQTVDKADEAELAQKFQNTDFGEPRTECGTITGVEIQQHGAPIGASARALVPIEITVCGQLMNPRGRADIELRCTRVDGRLIWVDRLSAHDGWLQHRLPFEVSVRMEPLVLGENLFRLDAILLDDRGLSCGLSRVFEVVDHDPPIGGRPMLNVSPVINVHALEEANQ